MDELRELIAAECHNQWSGWMEHIFKKCHIDPNDAFGIELVRRWKRQIETEYKDLSEEEQDSDRKEADKIIKILTEKGMLKEEINKDLDIGLKNVFFELAKYCAEHSLIHNVEADFPNEQGIIISQLDNKPMTPDQRNAIEKFLRDKDSTGESILTRHKTILKINDDYGNGNALFTFTPSCITDKFHKLSNTTLQDDQYRFGTRKMIEKQSAHRASFNPSVSFGGIRGYAKRKIAEDMIPPEIKSIIGSICPYCKKEIIKGSIYGKDVQYHNCGGRVRSSKPVSHIPFVEPSNGNSNGVSSAQRSNSSGEPKTMAPYTGRQNLSNTPSGNIDQAISAAMGIAPTVIRTDTASQKANPIVAFGIDNANHFSVPHMTIGRDGAAQEPTALGSTHSPSPSNVTSPPEDKGRFAVEPGHAIAVNKGQNFNAIDTGLNGAEGSESGFKPEPKSNINWNQRELDALSRKARK